MSWKRLSKEEQDALIQKSMLRPLPRGDPIEPDEVVSDEEEAAQDELVDEKDIDPDEPIRQ